MADHHGIAEASSVPSIFERWLDMNMAAERGVTPEVAEHARALYERSKPTITPPTKELAFELFEFPGDGKELGVHFGTRHQASALGEEFPFVLSIKNPLRLPDLGTWDYQSVMRDARKRDVPISEAEYDAVFNARDNNAALRELLIGKGYDGVVYKNEAEGHGESYIAFRQDQIQAVSDIDLSVFVQEPDDAGGLSLAQKAERAKRIEAIPELRNSAGPAYTLWEIASEFSEHAQAGEEGYWAEVESKTIVRSICDKGQLPETVHKALCKYSPDAVTSERQALILASANAFYKVHRAKMTNPTLSL